jgi:hypothetical protein
VVLTKTKGTVAEAVEPATVWPDKLPTVIVAPSWKFVPKIVIEALDVIAYVPDAGLTTPIVGVRAIAGTDTPHTTASTMPPRKRAHAPRR